MSSVQSVGRRSVLAAAVVVVVAGVGAGAFALRSTGAESRAAAAAQPQAMPVPVQVIQQQEVTTWDEFSGRLEAVERVDVRSRVAGAVQVGALPRRRAGEEGRPPDHHRSRALCGGGRPRRRPRSAAAQARAHLHEERARARAAPAGTRAPSRSASSTSASTPSSEADANLRAAQAALQIGAAEPRLHPGARAGCGPRRQARGHRRQPGRRRARRAGAHHAGVGQPDLRQLRRRRAGRRARAQGLPAAKRACRSSASRCRWAPSTNGGTPLEGRLQLIDNQVTRRAARCACARCSTTRTAA